MHVDGGQSGSDEPGIIFAGHNRQLNKNVNLMGQ